MSTQATENKKTILILPRWYPNKTDIQLGIFIQRQVVLIQNHFRVIVIYAQAIDQNEKFKLVKSETENTAEFVVYFKQSKGPFRKLTNFLRYRQAQKKGLAQIKSEQIDLCHVHVPYRSAIPALKLKKQGVPFLITEHWSGHLNGLFKKKNALDKWLYRRVLKKASGISVVSKPLQAAFKENTGFSSEVIPNYIEKSDQSISTASSEHIQILSVSDLDDRTKNVTGLVAAFALAFKENPNMRLTIVGGGPDEEKIKNQVQGLGLADGIINLTGRLNHEAVLEHMLQCHFYVCNSRFETFGMTIAEALLCGKPVVSTRCGGPESFLNENNSILIAPQRSEATENSNEELKSSLLKMALEFNKYNSNEISEAINREFGRDAVLKAWLTFYNLKD